MTDAMPKRKSSIPKAKKLRAEAPFPNKAASVRSHYLLAEVTPEEKKNILKHCKTQNMSVSRFLAQLALEDASTKKKASPEEPLTIRIKLPPGKRAKLLYIARLKEKS